MVTVKSCRTCGAEKELGEFYGRPSGWFQKDCKGCAKKATAQRNKLRYRESPEHRAKQIAHSQNTRSKCLGDVGQLNPAVIAVMLISTPRCEYCALPNLAEGLGFCLDHRLPLALGGRNDLENIAVVCDCCNRAKWDRPEAAYREWLSTLAARLSAVPALRPERE